jgi:hypothetical protein
MYRSVERVLRTFKKKIRQALEGKALCNLTCMVGCARGRNSRNGSTTSISSVSRGLPYLGASLSRSLYN